MDDSALVCRTCARRVKDAYQLLMRDWKRIINRLPRHLPEKLQKEVFQVILDRLIEALDSATPCCDAVCRQDRACEKLHESGHYMARNGYTIDEVLKRFAMLQKSIWDYLSSCLKACNGSHEHRMSDEEILVEHERCHYKISLFFQEITSSIARAYVEEMEIIVKEKEKELLNKEMEISRKVMEALLPQALPSIPGVDVAGRLIPAASIGGDYWHVIDSGKGHLDIVLADVMGHGIAAALLVAMIKYLHQALRGESLSMSTMMMRLNSTVVRDTPEELFITCLYGRADYERMVFSYVLAGHPGPLLVREGRIIHFKDVDVPLGLVRDFPYRMHTMKIKPGDVLIFLSDGLLDARSPEGEFYGHHQLERVLPGLAALPASEICSTLERLAFSFCGSRGCNDDITIAAVKFLHNE